MTIFKLKRIIKVYKNDIIVAKVLEEQIRVSESLRDVIEEAECIKGKPISAEAKDQIVKDVSIYGWYEFRFCKREVSIDEVDLVKYYCITKDEYEV